MRYVSPEYQHSLGDLAETLCTPERFLQTSLDRIRHLAEQTYITDERTAQLMVVPTQTVLTPEQRFDDAVARLGSMPTNVNRWSQTARIAIKETGEGKNDGVGLTIFSTFGGSKDRLAADSIKWFIRSDARQSKARQGLVCRGEVRLCDLEVSPAHATLQLNYLEQVLDIAEKHISQPTEES